MSLARQAARRRRPAVGAGLASGSAHTRLSATTDVTTLPHEISTAPHQTLCRHCSNRNGKRGTLRAVGRKRSEVKPKYSYLRTSGGGLCNGNACSASRAGKGQGPLTDASVISVVDDDDNMRRAIENLLQSLGYRVHGFASAEAFLRSPHADDTACLISDIAMPAVNGLELQRRLNDQGHRASILFITAYFDQSTERRALNAGAICVLGKPFDSGDLIECLAEALKRYRDRTSQN